MKYFGFNSIEITPIKILVKRTFIIIGLIFGLFAPNLNAQNWQLVWSDEFNYQGLPDPAKWGYDVGGNGWGNNELQYYTENDLDNARADGQNLIIEAREEAFGGRNYTSARLVTRNKGDWKYGRIAIRAKLPIGQGIWPAHWLLPTDWVYGGWAASGEMDIMELVGHEPETIHGTLHYGGGWPLNVFTGGSYTLGAGNFNQDFHIFEMVWEPDEVRWYVDGNHYQTQTAWHTNQANYPAPYDQRFHILLNIAVGGNWPGPPNSSTVFPQEMVIDYVRVYQDVDLPSIVITAPTAGAQFAAGDSLVIKAAPQVANTVGKVDFYQDDALLGTATAAPYEIVVRNLADGNYRLRAVVSDDAGRTNYSQFVNITVGNGGQSPFLMTPQVIPGVVEAEFFDNGGQGTAYNDTDDEVNNGSQYGTNTFRSHEGVDIEAAGDLGGGKNLGWLEAGEWLEYTVNVETGGAYSLISRVSSAIGGGVFNIFMNGVNVSGNINVNNTGGWQSWSGILTSNIQLNAGIQVLRLNVVNSGFNLNKLTFIENPSGTKVDNPDGLLREYALGQNYPNPFNPVTTIHFDLPKAGLVKLIVFDISGRAVLTLVNSHRQAGQHSVELNGNELGSGIYIYRMQAGTFEKSRKMILMK